MDVAKIDQQAVAKKMNKSAATVSERLGLLSLPKDLQDQVTERKLSIKAALEVGKVQNDKRRATLASKADRLTLDALKYTVKNILDKQKKGCKQHETRAAHPMFKEMFEGLPGKRVYKDQVTFVFKNEDELIATLRKFIERFESENHEH